MKVFNTLSGQKEDFLPHGDEVRMYVCGVTPYSDAHLGHAMSYIYFDAIQRYLQFHGYRVKYVQNITDIDDKIIDRAARLGVPARELAEQYINGYFDDMDALNIRRADIYPRATEEIPEMLKIIQSLVTKGYAYPAQGSIYFRVKNVPDYGKLSNRTLDSMMARVRIEPGDEKENPMDFVLWKATKPNEPSWDSPWGPGRPGWHIECSAMSVKYLGETIDIHGGGQDLIFPHHENEIAQSESFTGKKPFVKYWLHNGLLQLDEEKMSKSLGNLVTIKETLKKYRADTIRIFILHSHYRTPLTYDEGTLEASGVALRAFSDAKWKLSEPYAEINRSISEAQGTKTDGTTPANKYRNRFISAMDNDFNTPQAIAVLFDLAQDINRAVNLNHADKVIEHRNIFIELAGVLGLVLPEPERESLTLDIKELTEIKGLTIAQIKRENLEYLLEKTTTNHNVENTEGHINYLKELRDALRKDKKFKLADEIRTRLYGVGIVLEDTPKGTVPKRKQ